LTLLEETDERDFVVNEKAFYNHLANLSDMLNGIQPELESGIEDYLNKEKISEYHKIYKDVLLKSPLKEICKHHSKNKEFVITNTDKAREILLKNIPDGLKDHFWISGKSNFYILNITKICKNLLKLIRKNNWEKI